MLGNLKRRKFRIKVLFLLLFTVSIYPIDIFSASNTNEEPEVLVVFSSDGQVVDEHQRLLELLIAHFTTDITFKHSSEVGESDLTKATHLFYYGQVKERLPNNFVNAIKTYQGPFFGIGYNTEQLRHAYSLVGEGELEALENIVLSDRLGSHIVENHIPILVSNNEPNVNVLLKAKHESHEYPLLVRKNDVYYLATNVLFPPISTFLAEELHVFFEIDHPNQSTKALLRLEDVHPRIDANDVMEIAEYLKHKEIPYLVSVVPVYRNPATEEEYHLSENPKLVEALKFMQANGGNIVFHGYTDQYADAQTGEGFEFWDTVYNQPVYFPPGDSVAIKSEADFADLEEYQAYIEEKQTFEKTYIENILERGIHELVDYGLYPIAFEAPHYAMSQNGYQVLSNYFSTYLGQVQLTDKDWRIMTEAPTISQPSFLHDMTLIPETIRYIRYEDPSSIIEMKNRMNESVIVRDGIISGFYHPFLGKSGLVQLIYEMEKIPNIEWINLSEMDNTVQTERVTIKTINGQLMIERHDLNGKSEPNSNTGLSFEVLELIKSNIEWFLGGGILMLFLVFISYRFIAKAE